MRRAWIWLLYRLGLRKPPPFSELLTAALRGARREYILEQVLKSNALMRRFKDMK